MDIYSECLHVLKTLNYDISQKLLLLTIFYPNLTRNLGRDLKIDADVIKFLTKECVHLEDSLVNIIFPLFKSSEPYIKQILSHKSQYLQCHIVFKLQNVFSERKQIIQFIHIINLKNYKINVWNSLKVIDTGSTVSNLHTISFKTNKHMSAVEQHVSTNKHHTSLRIQSRITYGPSTTEPS